MNDGPEICRSARFRPSGDGPPPPPLVPEAPAFLRFLPAADLPGTDRDVVFGYQIILGRDPENSFVIADARSSPVHGFLRGLLTSDEFTGGVLAPLEAARPLPHERASRGPDEEQTAWLAGLLALDAIGSASLRDSRSWRDLLLVIAGLPGFPRPRSAVARGVPAAEASPGFVMITIETPRPDEPLPRGRLEGSGWVIAPSDIEEISILLGAQVVGKARFGLPRPDVARRFPHYRDVDRCGFAFSAELPAATAAGEAMLLTLVARTADGSLGRKSLRLGKAAASGAPSSLPDPDQAAVIVTVEHASPAAVSGWAVARTGVASVAIFHADVMVGQAHRDIRREDIAGLHAAYPAALLAGWSLPLAAGALGPGHHTLRAVATATDDEVAEQEFAVWVEGDGNDHPQARIRDIMPAAEAAFGLRLLAQAEARATFTILVRCGSDAVAIEATLRSLARQAFEHWHAILFVPDSEMRERTRALAEAMHLSGRLRIDTGERASDVGVGWICVLRAGDMLGCDALLEFAIATAVSPDTELIYADEEGLLKTDYDAEQLLNRNMLGRAWTATAHLCAAAKLTSAELAAVSDYDIALRLSEAAKRIVHTPLVLLRRGLDADLSDQEAAALTDAAVRRNIAADVLPGAAPTVWRFQRTFESACKISIIMPTCGARDLVRRAIASIRETTADLDVEIVVIDHLPARAKSLRSWLRKHADVVVRAEGRFNWSRFSNQGAAASSGDLLLFLNDDIEAKSSGWLQAMIEQAASTDVGVVGAKLLYPDGRVQHAGMYLAQHAARHAFRYARADDIGAFGLAAVTREVACVTGACMLMRRETYALVGGFDEAHGVINNDVDFCLRARASGLAIIVTPHASLVHHELASRAGVEDEHDAGRFVQDFRIDFARGDPWRPAHLLPGSDLFEIEPEPARIFYNGSCTPRSGAVLTILALAPGEPPDFIAAVPALRRLKRHFPNARLTLLASATIATLASGESSVDAHLTLAPGEHAVPPTIAAANFDLAIDLARDRASRTLLRESNAFMRVGFDRDDSFPWLDVALDPDDGAPRRGRQSTDALVDAATDALTRVSGPAITRPEAIDVAHILPPQLAGKNFACIQPGGTDPAFQWPTAAFATLIDVLAADLDLAIVLIGDAAELPTVESLLTRVAPGAPVFSLAGSIDPAMLPALLTRSALFVGHDSGALAVAAALGVPAVSVLDGRRPARDTTPAGDTTIAVQRQMRCSPCHITFADECPRALACLGGLRPQDVYTACRRVLAMGHARAPQPAKETPMPPPASSPRAASPASALLEQARQIAARPIQPPTGHGPQGYIEAVAQGGPGLLWIVGWMQPGASHEFPAVVASGGLQPGTLAIMRFARPNLPAGAYGIVGLLECDWQPPVNDLGEPIEFILLFGDAGQHHLRCHMPLRLISTATLAGDYQEMLDRYGHALQQSSSLRPHLGVLESWQPSRAGANWQGTSCSVDRLLVVPGLGCLVEGWVMSPLRRVEALRLRAGETIMNVEPQNLAWKPRPDLAANSPGAEAMAARAGFVGLFEGEAGPLDVVDPILKLVFEGGTSVNTAVSPQVIRRLGQSAGLEDARRFFPALEEEAFFPRFAAAAAAAERALMAPPVALHIALAERVLVFALPDERCDLFLLFEQVARHCRATGGAGPVQGIVFLGSMGAGRADALWMFREFRADLPWLAASLLLIGDPSHALMLLPDVLATVGAERFLFAAAGVFLTDQGWSQASRALVSEPAALVCFTEADALPGARCFGWSTARLAAWASGSVGFLGGFHADNGLAAENPVVVPSAIRVSRAAGRDRLREAVNGVLAGGRK